ncbi:MAG: alpha/beta hydrolase [Alphaproteobacteria bacterium]|nr:alpha/beta hydrolase [Alphaproteobacteria bacterium]
MELRSRTVSVNGTRTHYTEIGDAGPIIVALHGGGPGASGEAGMAALMRHMPPEYRVVALDSVGGFGRTDPRAPVPYGLQSRVDHLADFADAIGLERFTLLGNSQGAWVAARYGVTHPDRLERLVLIGTMTIAMAMGLPEEQTPGMQAFRGYDGSREAMRRLLEGLVYNPATITDDLVELRYASASRPGAMDSFAAASRGTRYLQADPVLRTQFDMREALPALTAAVPTMVIWGENDTFAPAAMGRKLEPMLPAARFHFVNEAGHQVQNDQPEACADLLASFMREPAAAGWS